MTTRRPRTLLAGDADPTAPADPRLERLAARIEDAQHAVDGVLLALRQLAAQLGGAR